MISNQEPKLSRTGGIIIGVILIMLFVFAWVYKFVYVGRDGYRFTIAIAKQNCSKPRSGEGYSFEYTVNGKVWNSECIPIRNPITIGTKYLIQYAEADPDHMTVLEYVLKDSIKVPINGWSDPPLSHFVDRPH